MINCNKLKTLRSMIYIYILQQQYDNVKFETSQIDPNKFSIYVMSNI